MWLRNALTFVQLLSAACIIGLVLLQRGKGADARKMVEIWKQVVASPKT